MLRNKAIANSATPPIIDNREASGTKINIAKEIQSNVSFYFDNYNKKNLRKDKDLE